MHFTMKQCRSSKHLLFFILMALTWFTPNSEGRGIGGGRGGPGGTSGVGTGRNVGKGVLVGGLGTYAAYRTWDNSNTNNRGPNPDNPETESQAYSENFNVLYSTYSQRREGSGMSAWSLLMIILGIIGGATLCWYCYAIGVPLWRDRQASRRRSYQLSSVNVKGSGDDMPLHETPSTATPSP